MTGVLNRLRGQVRLRVECAEEIAQTVPIL